MRRPPSIFVGERGWSIAFTLLTILGLLSALLSEGGAWRWLSWAELAVPPIVIARCWPLQGLFEGKTHL